MIYISTGPDAEVRIPPQYDPQLVKATLDALVTWPGVWPKLTDEDTVRIAAEHADTKARSERLRAFAERDPRLTIIFLRNVPAIHWPVATSEYSPLTFPMALAREIEDARFTKVVLNDQLLHATDDELRTLIASILNRDVKEVSLEGNRIVHRILPFLATTTQLLALWSKLAPTRGHWRLLRALPDDQVLFMLTHLEPRRLYVDGMAPFEALRRGRLDPARLEVELARAANEQPYERVERLFTIPRAGEFADCTEDEVLRAIVDAVRHAARLKPQLAAWFGRERATIRSASSLAQPTAMLLFVLTYDDAACAWFADLCNADKEWFRKSHQATRMGEHLADTLAARHDGEQILAALGKRLKGKTLANVIAQAVARLANHRVALGQSTKQELQWGRTDGDDALRLLKTFDDPRAAVEAGITSDDPVAALNAFVTAMALVARPVNDTSSATAAVEARTTWTWSFVETALRTLERTYTPAAPDHKALAKLIGGHHSAAYRIEPALRWFYWMDQGRPGEDVAARTKFNDEVLIPLYVSTTNVRFRRWIEPIVVQLRPDLAEPIRHRLVRLAKAAAAETDDTTTCSFVFRGTERPGKATINRLLGPPIGVGKKRWPKHGKKPMVHLITFETRLLAPSVRESLTSANTAAIAVFVSSLSEHKAFAPGNAHSAVVALSADDLACGAAEVATDEVTSAGVTLDVITCELPSSVFQGGAKQGALWELRRLLDEGAFLRFDRTSPDWIQDPEPSGQFLFDLDDRVAPELNLGDQGRFYVFEDTAFMQCH